MSKKQSQQPEEINQPLPTPPCQGGERGGNQPCEKCPDCECSPCECGKNCTCDKPATDWENIAKRALADLDNYKKQQEKLRGELTQFMNMALLARFLDINDDLSRVLHTVQNKKLDPATIPPDVLQCQMGVMEGITNILKKFDEVFKAEGLDKIEVKPGDKFDPAIMEAISHEDHAEHKDDAVIEQLQAGLKYKDQIIKPAKVRVGK